MPKKAAAILTKASYQTQNPPIRAEFPHPEIPRQVSFLCVYSEWPAPSRVVQCCQTYKSSTSHSKTGQYTSMETSRGDSIPTRTYTVQDNTNTGQTYTGQQNKLKDAGTRLSKIGKTHAEML